MIKIFKALLVLFMALVALFVAGFTDNETPVLIVYGFFVSGIGLFLETNVAKMIKLTAIKPAGQFEQFRFWRFLWCALMFIPLIIVAMIQNYDTAVGLAASGVIVIASLIISGLNRNKAVTG